MAETYSLFEHSVAREIRKAYGEAVGGQMRYHIESQPWSTLPWERQYKWLEMAHTAVTMAEEEWFDTNI